MLKYPIPAGNRRARFCEKRPALIACPAALGSSVCPLNKSSLSFGVSPDGTSDCGDTAPTGPAEPTEPGGRAIQQKEYCHKTSFSELHGTLLKILGIH